MLHTLVNEGIEEIRNSNDKISIELFNDNEPIPLREALLLIAKKSFEKFKKERDVTLIIIYELYFVDKIKFTELLKNMFSNKKRFIPIIKYFDALKERGEIRELNYRISFKVFMSTLMGLMFYSNYSGKFEESYLKMVIDYFADLWKA